MIFVLFSLWSHVLLGQQSIEGWATYFKARYNLEILTDSTSMAKLELQNRTRITDKDGINYVAHQFGIEYQFNRKLIKKHLALLAREFSKYPDNFFRKIDLRFLCLAETATYAGQVRAAIPDQFRRALILETSERLKNDTTYQKHVFHHDLFHYVESTMNSRQVIFKKWDKLNAKDFRYQGSGAIQFNPKYTHVNWSYVHPQLGFITNYAMTAGEEDRAELAAFLLIAEKRKILMPLLVADKVLRKKVAKVWRFLNALGIIVPYH